MIRNKNATTIVGKMEIDSRQWSTAAIWDHSKPISITAKHSLDIINFEEH